MARTTSKSRTKRGKTKGIFCLEADWGVQDSTTVEPILMLLKSMAGVRVPYVHRDVGTREEFDHYLRKWTNKTLSRFPILYLGFHGEPGYLDVGEGRGASREVPIEEVAEQLERKCKGRVIHFGSCGTLRTHVRKLEVLRHRTGAAAFLGYKKDVSWVDSSAFEVLLLGELQRVDFNRSGMGVLERRLQAYAPGLVKRLGFRMIA